jgi:hypothetical protein
VEFEKTHTVVSTLPFKERIRWYQQRGNECGYPLTWQQAKSLANEPQGDLYINETYTVLVYEGAEADHMIGPEELKGRCTYISIRRNDREPAHSWTDFQAIKNYFCGEEREGMEIYPATRRLVDAANQYHIFVLPEGSSIPFGMCLNAASPEEGK